MRNTLWRGTATIFLLAWVAAASVAQENSTLRLAAELKPLLSCLSGQRASFRLSGEITAPIEGQPQQVAVRLERFDAASFDVSVKHADYWVELRRRADVTALALPLHNVVYVGRGATDSADHLAPDGCLTRLLSPGSLVSAYAPLALQSDPNCAGAGDDRSVAGSLRSAGIALVGGQERFAANDGGSADAATADRRRSRASGAGRCANAASGRRLARAAGRGAAAR